MVAITTVDVTKQMGHVQAVNLDIMIPFAIETVQAIVDFCKIIKAGMTVTIAMELAMDVKRDDTAMAVGNSVDQSA